MKISICALLILLVQIITISFSSFASSTDPDNNIYEIIDLIKSRLNVNTMECMYKSIYFINPKFTGNVDFKKQCIFSFKLSKDDFVVILERDEEKENKKSNYSMMYNDIDKPTNLLEVFVNRYYRPYKSNKDSISYKKTHEKLYYYFYKNTGKTLFLEFNGNNEKPTIVDEPASDLAKFDIYARFGDPRYLIGYIGLFLDDKNYPEFPIPSKITNLLDLPGKTIVRHEGDYTVLLHVVNNPNKHEIKHRFLVSEVDNLINEYLKWFSFEIWIDKFANIVKILEIDYFPILYGETFVSNLCGYNNSPFKPCEIRRTFEFEDFKEFSEGIRLPMKGKITTHKYWVTLTNPNIEEGNIDLINSYYNEKKISVEEYRTLSYCYTNIDDYDYILNIELNPETVKINHHISEESFIPPKVNFPPSSENNLQTNKTQITRLLSWVNRYKQYLLSIILILIITFVFNFIINHFWSKARKQEK